MHFNRKLFFTMSTDFPTPISEFHLEVFLGQLAADNYSVFIAEGNLPTYGNEVGPDMGGNGKWHLASDLLDNKPTQNQIQAPPKFAGVGRRLDGGASKSGATPVGSHDVDEEQMMLEEAIRLSMQDAKGSDDSHSAPVSKKDEMRALRLAALDKRSKS